MQMDWPCMYVHHVTGITRDTNVYISSTRIRVWSVASVFTLCISSTILTYAIEIHYYRQRHYSLLLLTFLRI